MDSGDHRAGETRNGGPAPDELTGVSRARIFQQRATRGVLLSAAGRDRDVWVVGALAQELGLLVAELGAELETPRGHFPHHVAVVGPGLVRLVALGVGVVSAALTLGRLVALGLPEAAIMVGSAGALPGSGCGMGDLVAADEEILAELGVLAGPGQGDAGEMGLASLVQRVALDRSLVDEVTAAAEPAAGVRRGTLLTVVGVSARPEQAEARARRFQALAENMEGYALALAGRCFGFRTAEIRGISNRAGDRDKSRWDLTTAQERAQLAVLKYLKRRR